MSTAPNFTDDQLQALIAFGAQKFASPDTEGHWMPCHQGATGPVADEVIEQRGTAIRRAIRQSNEIPTWRPFLMTRQGDELLLYSIGLQGQGGQHRASRQKCVSPVAQAPLYLYLEPPPLSYSRDRQSPLAAD